MPDHDLDLIGLKCPLPALRTRAALLRLRPGDRLSVRASDPLAAIDIPHAARDAFGVTESCATHDGIVTVAIRRTESPDDGPVDP